MPDTGGRSRILPGFAPQRANPGDDVVRQPALLRIEAEAGKVPVEIVSGREKLDHVLGPVFVELRVFGGLTIAETASMLEVSEATVDREWLMAKAWLRTELRARR